jgi:hypothetical protein
MRKESGILDKLDAEHPKTAEDALAYLRALTKEERANAVFCCNRAIRNLEDEYDANEDNEDAIFQNAIDARQRERIALIKMYRATLVLLEKAK